MEIIELPFLVPEPTTKTQEALEILKTSQRAGLVLKQDGELTLIYIRHLLEAIRSGNALLRDVSDGYRVYQMTNDEVKYFKIDPFQPVQTWNNYERFFGNLDQSHDYLLASQGANTMIVITRSERFRNALAATGGFTCNGEPEAHFFPDPEVFAGQRCPKYPRCKRSDGVIPTISPI